MIPSGRVPRHLEVEQGLSQTQAEQSSTNLQMMLALPRLLALKAVPPSRVPAATFAVINTPAYQEERLGHQALLLSLF